MSFKIITLKWYHDGELRLGTFHEYVGGTTTLTLDVDVDMLSLIELMNMTVEMNLKDVAELYICPKDRGDKLVNVVTDRDILDISNYLDNGDCLEIYVTHCAPLKVYDPNKDKVPHYDLVDEDSIDLTEGAAGVDESECNSNFRAGSSQPRSQADSNNFPTAEPEQRAAAPRQPTPRPAAPKQAEPRPAVPRPVAPNPKKQNQAEPIPEPEDSETEDFFNQEEGVFTDPDEVEEESERVFADEIEKEGETDLDYDSSSSESDGVDVDVVDDAEYGSDIHEEFVEAREELREYRRRRRRRRGERPPSKPDINLGDAGNDIGFDELNPNGKHNSYEGLVGGDEPYYGSSEAESFASDNEDGSDGEHRRKERRVKRKFYDPTAEKVTWELGLLFENVQQFRFALSTYAIQRGVQLEKYINEPKRVKVRCLKEGCDWTLAASYHRKSGNFRVHRYHPIHKCYKTNKNPFLRCSWLAEKYRARICSQPNMKVWELKQLIKEELGMYVGRSTVHRARSKILQEIIGDETEEYKRLYDYRDVLLKTNPGSTCIVKAVDNGISQNHTFQSFYVCFHAMKQGWLHGCRRIIGLDGCFLKGLCKGLLLVAVSKDGNNQMFPIAWAIVECENTTTWSWFIRCLIDDLGLKEGSNLTIMSDMQKGMRNAVRNLLPEAEHRMCARHVLANWSKNWRGLERRKKFWAIARASCIAEMDKNMDELGKLGAGITDSIANYVPEQWARAYFSPTSQCDTVDNNMCETFNSWILEERHKTIITMLEGIRKKMMSRVVKLREFSKGWIEDISPMAMKVYEKNVADSMLCSLIWNGEGGFEVSHGKFTHCVQLDELTCSCRSWSLKGIPCAHAIAAMHHNNIDPTLHIAHWYHKETYLKAYSYVIQPVPSQIMWPKSNHPIIDPPPYKKLPGRPKKKRRREETEPPKSGKLPRTGMLMTCSICKAFGHNKRGCHLNPKNGPVRGTQTVEDADVGAGRGRGRGDTVRGRRRGARGFGLYQGNNGFAAYFNASGSSRVINQGERINSSSKVESSYKPTKKQPTWKGKPAITRAELEKKARNRCKQTQESSSSHQPI